jgi:nucleoside-diphosphate-sugar epimerase
VILITGATGFIGHYLLADLLRRGQPCAVLLRPPLADSASRLADLMAELGVDTGHHQRRGELVLLEGDVVRGLPAALGTPVSAVIHVAASTRFQPDNTGEPVRTNVQGTANLLAWMSQHQIATLHLVSSAYQCGRVREPVAEVFRPDPPDFHNAYERSKWTGEQQALQWAAQDRRRCVTILRPSVVVGDDAHGRASKFSGFYLVPRATQILSQSDQADRLRIPLRICGRPHEQQNIVPVDYVAGMIGHVATHPDTHGRVYHLTHPQAPSNQQIKAALESFFGVGGGSFVDPRQFQHDQLNTMERLFYSASEPVRHYFQDTPCFLRAHADELERQANLRCRPYDEAKLHRLFRYATARQWGNRRVQAPRQAASCAAYFERFLPQRVPQSRIAAMSALSPTIRFIIEDEPDGNWVLRFDQGRLLQVHRGSNGLREDFTYRTRRDVFWRAITGSVHPQQLFLTGDAALSGDIEQGLKMAMILHEFNKEHPCTPADLEPLRSTP